VDHLYVFALTDVPVMPWEEDDGRRITSVEVEDIYAIAERRDNRPEPTERELQRQHTIVQRIADAAPAVLPARFGSHVELEELEAIVRQRLDVIHEALDLVRDRVQMTLRVAAPATPPPRPRPAPTSGREYLRRRHEEMFPLVPKDAESALRAVRAFIVAERRRSAENGVVSIYHLVRKSDVKEYRDALHSAAPAISVTGPWPAFAFAPEF
jgi:hypothetical protein